MREFRSRGSVRGAVGNDRPYRELGGAGCRSSHVRNARAPWKGGAFQWVQIPPGNRSSRKQPEQSWR